jgi:hypothetical protein
MPQEILSILEAHPGCPEKGGLEPLDTGLWQVNGLSRVKPRSRM